MVHYHFFLNIANMSRLRAIGLMSGTSMDGVDAALIETDGEKYVKVIEEASIDYPKEFHVPVGSNVYVRVFNIVPGLRLRIPCILVSGVPKDVVGIPTKAEDIYPQIREIQEIMRVKNLNSFEMI